jgi:hypothetical protein
MLHGATAMDDSGAVTKGEEGSHRRTRRAGNQTCLPEIVDSWSACMNIHYAGANRDSSRDASAGR